MQLVPERAGSVGIFHLLETSDRLRTASMGPNVNRAAEAAVLGRVIPAIDRVGSQFKTLREFRIAEQFVFFGRALVSRSPKRLRIGSVAFRRRGAESHESHEQRRQNVHWLAPRRHGRERPWNTLRFSSSRTPVPCRSCGSGRPRFTSPAMAFRGGGVDSSGRLGSEQDILSECERGPRLLRRPGADQERLITAFKAATTG